MRPFIYGTAILAIIAAIFLIFQDHPLFNPAPTQPLVNEQPAEATRQVPVVKYPVPPTLPQEKPEAESQEKNLDSAVAEPVPKLTLEENLKQWIGEDRLFALLQVENLIQRFVATIDSLPEKSISRHHLPVTPPGGSFLVTNDRISPANGKRYTLYLDLIEGLGVEHAVSLYVLFYDLFQSAYRNLGYPDGHFNDRFVEVIDHLLATPKLDASPLVTKPLLVYKYVDPELEQLSAGQKLMLRIGSENRARLENVLLPLRERLTSLSDAPAG